MPLPESFWQDEPTPPKTVTVQVLSNGDNSLFPVTMKEETLREYAKADAEVTAKLFQLFQEEDHRKRRRRHRR